MSRTLAAGVSREPSRLLTWLVSRKQSFDYLWLALLAALPAAAATVVGVHTTVDGFVGYLDRLNYPVQVVVLPAAAFAFRWLLSRIAPVSEPALPSPPPPVVGLIESKTGRDVAYDALRSAVLSKANLWVTLLLTLVVNGMDFAPRAAVYSSGVTRICTVDGVGDAAGDCIQQFEVAGLCSAAATDYLGQRDRHVRKDWSVAYLGSAGVGKGANLAVTLCAYFVQSVTVFIALLFAVLVARHNWFFLASIYQRRRVSEGEEYRYIAIDLDDHDDCFGLRGANAAFNAQLLALAIAAVLLLSTRFPNVDRELGLLPTPGQLFAVFGWLVGLVILSMPILVKLLPRLPLFGAGVAPTTLEDYLREFLPDVRWAWQPGTLRKEVEDVAGRFAQNAFWPTGNNRAWPLYVLAFWVFLVVLVPYPALLLPPAWAPCSRWIGLNLVGWLAFGLVAGATTWAFFGFLRSMLRFVDDRLVEPRPDFEAKDATWRTSVPVEVFICYRRSDSAVYAARLRDSLARHGLKEDTLFLDFTSIPPGVKWENHIDNALASTQAMIVVIGPKWLSVTDEHGRSRLANPEDEVRREVTFGLQRANSQPEFRLFPALVGEAAMPKKSQLPVGLHELTKHQAQKIRDDIWEQDVRRLLGELRKLTDPVAESTGQRSADDPAR